MDSRVHKRGLKIEWLQGKIDTKVSSRWLLLLGKWRLGRKINKIYLADERIIYNESEPHWKMLKRGIERRMVVNGKIGEFFNGKGWIWGKWRSSVRFDFWRENLWFGFDLIWKINGQVISWVESELQRDYNENIRVFEVT